ncbi:phage holin family protein [Dermatophilus congolensis]|uniref:Protein of uncharacterized function (DUF1469) n=1 Tax=Dermatophilus congolensis TaxID=1863 RepID=A0A239VAM7_9MICO|nr:phage holin family protein [Dermatophilus congolensis]MBO3130647.1 phage holin family protein [Dermatophilus congolensis]MBO3130723.1 phage holin family protein [Dermatophilus congolensis]MBO3135120.1 phage holin family protein [Dermatophilus congolensis]MBO3137359.1 phage holin family protein [Dermatophilus congolensis]MBO3139600.1 phage holin family protein [Dermatophilus congolensis]
MPTNIPPTEKPEASRPADPSLGRLINSALEDVSSLVRSEIELAKLEITKDLKKAVVGAAMFIVAAVFAVFGLVFLLHTLALALVALGLAPWLGYLIVTLLLFGAAAGVAFIGKSKVSEVNPTPKRAVATTKDTLDSLKRSKSGEATAAVRRQDAFASGATSSFTARLENASSSPEIRH